MSCRVAPKSVSNRCLRRFSDQNVTNAQRIINIAQKILRAESEILFQLSSCTHTNRSASNKPTFCILSLKRGGHSNPCWGGARPEKVIRRNDPSTVGRWNGCTGAWAWCRLPISRTVRSDGFRRSISFQNEGFGSGTVPISVTLQWQLL